MPGFEPSPESYAIALAFYEVAGDRMIAAGASCTDDFNLFTAMVSGLSHRQVTNDPGGERWVRLPGRSVQMHIADLDPHPKTDQTPSGEATP